MAHKALIGGTAYEISGGNSIVNGTAYSIDKGKTLVGGTAYEVGLGGFTPVADLGTVTFTYFSFAKYYYTSNVAVSIAAGTEREINALSINGNIIPLTYTKVFTSEILLANYENIDLVPKEAGKYKVILNTTNDVVSSVQIQSFTNDGPCNALIGTI